MNKHAYKQGNLIKFLLIHFHISCIVNEGHFKIKEHPQIFLEPISLKPKPKINLPAPPKPHEPHQLEVPVYNKDQVPHDHHHISDDQVAAAVDAAIKTVPAPDVACYDDAAATVDTVMNTTTDAEVGLSVADAAQAALAAQAAAPEHVANQQAQI